MSTLTKPRLPTWARWSLFWTLFIGVGAVVGAVLMWITPGSPDTFGMAGLLEPMQALPLISPLLTSFTWPGIFLLLVNGLPQLLAAWMILARRRPAPVAVLCCGALLMGWITIQFVIYPFNWTSTSYFIFGLLEAGMALLWLRQVRGERQVRL